MSYMMVPLRPFKQETFRFSIREVSSGYEKRRFVRSVPGLYEGDLYGTPPLLSRRSNTLNPRRNPALASVEMALFLAESPSIGLGAEQVVGTIVALIDPQYNESHKANVGFFDLFETISNQEVATALLEAAETWILEHLPEVESVRGPAGLDCPYLPGALVGGFHHRPASFLPYNPPCYPELIEAAGYEAAGDLLAYSLDIAPWTEAGHAAHTALRIATDELRERLRLTVRGLTTQELVSGGGAAQRIFRSGWVLACDLAEPRAALPCATSEGLSYFLDRFKPRLDPALALVCERDGEAVAAALALPDAGVVSRKALSRFLLPGHLRQRLSNLRPDGIWVLPASIEPTACGQGVEVLLYSEMAAIAADRGYRQVEFWPVSAGDAATKQTLERIGARTSRVYRVYEKVL